MGQSCGMDPPDIKTLQQQLRHICIEHCMMERSIDWARAGLGSKASQLAEEGNSYRRNAICARMAELEAWIRAEEFRLEISGLNMFSLTMQLDMLLGIEPELLNLDKRPWHISSQAPGAFLPPPPPRL